MNDAPTAVDLFAGGGGLTVGLKKAGFRVVSAVEVDQDAFSTYKANHPEVKAFKQDIRTIRGKDLLAHSPTGTIDLLAGCPPCQGFSSLTRQFRNRSDMRNSLVREMARLVREIVPRVVMMENVPGLAKAEQPFFQEFLQTLNELDYRTSWDILQVADFGVPQSRRRLVLLAGRGFRVPLPTPTHARIATEGKKPWRTLREVISNMPQPVTFSEASKRGGPPNFDWHIVRNISDITLKRLRATKAGEPRKALPEELRPPCHKGINDGFTNVYGRMSWDQVSVTITAGCLTLSKGRFGHPEEDRTISLLEAAKIQTFPEGYIIDTPYIDKALQIVGNALPCDFAQVVSSTCFDALGALDFPLSQART